MSSGILELDPDYRAASNGSAWHDRSDRGRYRILGARAREMVSGLVTNDVQALAPGEGCYAAALTAKGKIVADLRVFAFVEDVLTDVSPRARPGWADMLKKFVNPRLARHRDDTDTFGQIVVLGPHAPSAAAAATGAEVAAVEALEVFRHVTTGEEIIVARVPDFGVSAFEVFFPNARKAAIVEGLRGAGTREVGDGLLETLRVEAGRPEWGLDMDESTLAQEANMEELNAISFTKGCYVGQETVARVHFRGHVNRHLRGLQFDGDTIAATGSEVVDVTEKSVGEVRSAVRSPRLGPIALAMMRREVEMGSRVQVRSADAVRGATVVPLPFAR